jgi:hypothetical protein
LFDCTNIPYFDFKTFKNNEKEVGLAAEKVAKTSCIDATAMERKLTLEQAEIIAKLLLRPKYRVCMDKRSLCKVRLLSDMNG